MRFVRWGAALAMAGACLAQTAPAPSAVNLQAKDGTVLKGTYFPAAKPGPGVLLLHQCNQDRRIWNGFGSRLAEFGIHVLTFDFRGFGESGGDRFLKLPDEQQNQLQSGVWHGDVDAAFQYLANLPGVKKNELAVGGGSCGVEQAVELARRHPEVKSLLLMAGPPTTEGRRFLQSSKNLPIFTAAADDDVYGPQALMMQWLYSTSPNSSSRFAELESGGHAAEVFNEHPELMDTIARWYLAVLTEEGVPVPKTNGFAMDSKIRKGLEDIDQNGGGNAVDARRRLLLDRARGKKPVLLPEYIVNLLGYEHMQAGDEKGAEEIFRYNVEAYPDSPNACDSLADAYLANGKRDLALENSRRALELLAKDKTEPPERHKAIQQSAEQKIKQLTGK